MDKYSRDNLRTCKFSPKEDEILEGWFHCWSWAKNKNGNNLLLAVVETEDGNVRTYVAYDFYFTDI